jgi:hypothetical protein
VRSFSGYNQVGCAVNRVNCSPASRDDASLLCGNSDAYQGRWAPGIIDVAPQSAFKKNMLQLPRKFPPDTLGEMSAL